MSKQLPNKNHNHYYIIYFLLAALFIAVLFGDRIRWEQLIASGNPLLPFLASVLGIFVRSVWNPGIAYLSDPTKGLHIGPPKALIVRLMFSVCAAALTFVPLYESVIHSTQELWVLCFLCHQHGFAVSAALEKINGSSYVLGTENALPLSQGLEDE